MFKTMNDNTAPKAQNVHTQYVVCTGQEDTALGTLFNITSQYKTDDAVGVLLSTYGDYWVAVSTPFGVSFIKPYTKRHQAVVQYVRDYAEASVLIEVAQQEDSSA